MNVTVRPSEMAAPALAPVAAGTADEARAFLARFPGVTHVDAIFVDLCGRVRGKRYPIRDLEKLYDSGLQIPLTVYLLDVTGAMSDPMGRGFEDGDPDGHAYPVAGTLVPALWADPPRAQVQMTLTEARRPAMVEPRNILRHVLQRFAPLGLKPVVAFELEFYLIDRKRGAGREPLIAADIAGETPVVGNVYEIRELDRFSRVLEAIEAAALAQGVPTSAATSEYSAGQFEINLQHTDDCVVAADHSALLRHIVVSIARAHGLDATFLPKPWIDRAGSGLHVHCSLVDAAGANVFDDGSLQGSPLLRHAIGGLQATMGDAMAIFASNLNAYRRYVPNLFVPVNRHWGVNNRSTGLRVPAGDSAARRIEHRVSGADSNPYLVLAAMLAGMHYGLTNKLDPGPAFVGNASGEVDPTLPLNIDDALRAFQSSALMREYLTGTYVDLYAETKKGELKTFRQVISPQEYDWYL
ncbi:MAG: glutamine synthetase family protein [Alphaproteobacteria bacterium]